MLKFLPCIRKRARVVTSSVVGISGLTETCKMTTLETLKFDNLALRRLPIDAEERNYVRTVSGACFSKVKPSPVKGPKTISYSPSAMSLLDLPRNELEREEFAEYFSGCKLLPGSDPAAHCYCGHQFGFFSGQLGDGAAMYLGEVLNSKGERWEIQLKGAGLTPYSRSADGRKVMRSSIREFLCSEAMHFLGIPTTRAGACVASETEVIRDIFYDCHPVKEKCTVVLRIAPTFLRFGSFEVFKTLDPVTRKRGPSVGRHDILIQLLDYTIETFYPEIHAEYKGNTEERYAEFFKEVVIRTCHLVADWQCVGFCHGVLNTDNMSIVGVTIDYGPFGFMDMYNPDHISNESDDNCLYSYIKQPEICLWNLKKLAEAIAPALPLYVSASAIELFESEYETYYVRKMRQKLGLLKELPDDKDLVQVLLDTMENTTADFTNIFRCMSSLQLPGLPGHKASVDDLKKKLVNQCYSKDVALKALETSKGSRNTQLLLSLGKINPWFSKHIKDSGIDVQKLSQKLETNEKLEEMSPDEKKERVQTLWSQWLEMYSLRLQSEVLEDTDENELEKLQAQRVKMMNSVNPRFILRNHVAQNAINKAEAGDFTEVERVLRLLEKPFEDHTDLEYVDENAASSSSKSLDESEHGHCSKESYVDHVMEVEKLAPAWSLSLRVT